MLALLLACASQQPAEVYTAPTIVATSFPAWYLADRLTDVEVRCILPPGQDPQAWQPDGALIASLSAADLIVSSGAGFEAWMSTAALPESRVVDLSAGLELIRLEATTHSHGIGGAHSHDGVDPHAWLDPASYRVQAEALAAVLTERGLTVVELPELLAQLDGLDAAYAEHLSDPRLPVLLANHPAYGYLARRHALTIPSLDLDPQGLSGAAPTVPEGAVLLWEEPPSDVVVAAIPARHVVLDPLEQPPVGGAYDYIAQSQVNITRLAELLAEAADGDHSP
ncbi:MAG: metal ABC transporter substrate-binding protein [Myxococcota bacterium]|nr:metal ABC transporter substrate-binding protein [Myxococcota bacterium]